MLGLRGFKKGREECCVCFCFLWDSYFFIRLWLAFRDDPIAVRYDFVFDWTILPLGSFSGAVFLCCPPVVGEVNEPHVKE